MKPMTIAAKGCVATIPARPQPKAFKKLKAFIILKMSDLQNMYYSTHYSTKAIFNPIIHLYATL